MTWLLFLLVLLLASTGGYLTRCDAAETPVEAVYAIGNKIAGYLLLGFAGLIAALMVLL